jgi:hypothetical protein
VTFKSAAKLSPADNKKKLFVFDTPFELNPTRIDTDPVLTFLTIILFVICGKAISSGVEPLAGTANELETHGIPDTW